MAIQPTWPSRSVQLWRTREGMLYRDIQAVAALDWPMRFEPHPTEPDEYVPIEALRKLRGAIDDFRANTVQVASAASITPSVSCESLVQLVAAYSRAAAAVCRDEPFTMDSIDLVRHQAKLTVDVLGQIIRDDDPCGERCYLMRMQGCTWRAIVKEIAKHPEWAGPETENGVKARAEAFAEKHKLPKLQRGEPGRPKNRTK